MNTLHKFVLVLSALMVSAVVIKSDQSQKLPVRKSSPVAVQLKSDQSEKLPASNPLLVAIQLKPVPAVLKNKLCKRSVVSSGVAPFGVNAEPVWAISLAADKSDKNAVLEFWQTDKRNSFSLLRRFVLPLEVGKSLSPQDLSSIKLRWLLPSLRRSPVIVLSSREYVVLYVFEKGWRDTKPLKQTIEAISGYSGDDVYNFDTVDDKGFLMGEVFVFYHMSSPEDNPGSFYQVKWKSGYGWK